MIKRIVALVFAAAVTVGLASAPAHAAAAAKLGKPAVSQISKAGWEWTGH